MERTRTTKFLVSMAVLFTICASTIFYFMLKRTYQVEEILHRSKRALEDAFIKEALQLHNDLRKKHGSPPLTIDKKLCAGATGAELWAKKQATDSQKAGKLSMTHSGSSGFGENIGACKCKAWTADKITNAWYGKIKSHNWSDNFFNYKTGHFTQMIWKETKTFCIARYTAGDYSSVVADYQPRGNANYRSSFAANVFPPKK